MEYLDAVIGAKEIYAATHRSLRQAHGDMEYLDAVIGAKEIYATTLHSSPCNTERCQAELTLP